MYDTGQGVDQNCKQAIELWGKAARQGHTMALLNMSLMYKDGVGVQKDIHRAFEFLYRAASSGHADAQFCIGEEYQSGEFLKQDYSKAIHWYRMAAAQGDEEAREAIECILRESDESNSLRTAAESTRPKRSMSRLEPLVEDDDEKGAH